VCAKLACGPQSVDAAHLSETAPSSGQRQHLPSGTVLRERVRNVHATQRHRQPPHTAAVTSPTPPHANQGDRYARERVYPVAMSEDVELEQLLKAHQGELKAIAEAAGSGNQAKVVDAVSSLAISLATGSPLLGALAPLGRKTIARAFGSSVNAALARELAVLAKGDERQAFLSQIGDVVEALLGQALIQIIRSQHTVKDEVFDALGGMRRDFEAFRNDFTEKLASASETVRVDSLIVRTGGLGVRVAATTSRRVALRHMVVSGSGSVGIDLT
jgi:hypothetical protein